MNSSSLLVNLLIVVITLKSCDFGLKYYCHTVKDAVSGPIYESETRLRDTFPPLVSLCLCLTLPHLCLWTYAALPSGFSDVTPHLSALFPPTHLPRWTLCLNLSACQMLGAMVQQSAEHPDSSLAGPACSLPPPCFFQGGGVGSYFPSALPPN